MNLLISFFFHHTLVYIHAVHQPCTIHMYPEIMAVKIFGKLDFNLANLLIFFTVVANGLNFNFAVHLKIASLLKLNPCQYFMLYSIHVLTVSMLYPLVDNKELIQQ